MFTGLSAFPLTPLRDGAVDEASYVRLVERLAAAGVESITALGSTGSYMYLDSDERRRVVDLAVRHAGHVPVMAGIGALRTEQVLRLADDAQAAGASAVLLAPVTYQALTDDEVFGLFEDVTASLSVPLVVYDNPGTTHVTFTTELYTRIAELPNVASIKIPGVPPVLDAAIERVREIREALPSTVSIGVSGDPFAATGLSAGCDVWYSVIGGTLPGAALAISRAALAGDHAAAEAASHRLDELWRFFRRFGSIRVTAAIAAHLGLVGPDSLPRPVRGLDTATRTEIGRVVDTLGLDD